MKLSVEKLRELLTGPGHISKEKFNSAAAEAKKEDIPLERLLVERGLVLDENLGKIIAESSDYRFIDLKREEISENILRIVPELVARIQQVIVFDKNKNGLKVAMVDPDNYEMAKWLEKKTGEKVRVYYATSFGIRDALKFYRKKIKEEFADIIKSQVREAERLKVRAEDVPIIKIVDTLIEYAYENGASDIHIEPLENKTLVRFRIDGVLHNVVDLPKDIHGLVIARIKVLSRLRTDEHFAAQDGKFQVKLKPASGFGRREEKFDIRVSIVPVTDGENVVMRLLSERARRFTLEHLGFSNKNFKKIKNVIKKPYGMVLATGPTGCGKTTTLYSILKILNKPEINITTIEDPVEYDVEGVSQIQVNPKTQLTFAKGLRSIVRQDPDIIMIGEIRDNETAGIAVNSAMTGHLVLSTMHANTAATNIIRLIDMGIEPFLVASSINVIVAQRLVRKVCSKCRQSYEISKSALQNLDLSEELIKKILGKREKIRVYQGQGCRACSETGYSGRIGIFEILEIQDNIKETIMQRANADEIEAQAIKNGMTTMIDDGINKILIGITTLEEVLRVTRE
ncbi:type II/IV secretion system protein [Patescibacteria group bacterium]|nr:type II/IV secretion system protein [Patescibacteria group bacterium]